MKTHQLVAKLPNAPGKAAGSKRADGKKPGLQRRSVASDVPNAIPHLPMPALASIPVQRAEAAQAPMQLYPAHFGFYSAPPANTEVFDGSGARLASVRESNGLWATVAPADWGTGTHTTPGVRYVSQAMGNAFGGRWVAGHMLNNWLGGPGDDQRNITAFTNRDNSHHLHDIEAAAKTAVHGGHTIDYITRVKTRSDFKDTASGAEVHNLATKLAGGYAATGSHVAEHEIDLGLHAGGTIIKGADKAQ